MQQPHKPVKPVLFGVAAASAFVAAAAWLAPVTAEEPPSGPVVQKGEQGCVEPETPQAPRPAPMIEVVFAVDTTGSMGGLIEGAKQKVWSIANEILSGTPRPRLRVGLIAYRDRNDAYVTQITPLTEDLDAVYTKLRAFEAGGGGDTPEHVNHALNDAFTRIEWNTQANLRLVYLVGDAPAHRDYDKQMDYASIVPSARQRGITVNAVLCGGDPSARSQFQEIAQLGGGAFFQVDQSGGMQAMATPYDERLRRIARELEETRVAYGSAGERRKAEEAKARVMEMDGEAAAARASAVSKMAPAAAPRADRDLVEVYKRGALDEVAAESLPAELQSLSKEDRAKKLAETASRRAELERQLSEVSRERDAFVKQKAPKDGFDGKVLDSLKEQAAEAGITYE